jgi:ATP synthase subunit 6
MLWIRFFIVFCMMFFSPLEQFSILKILPLSFGIFDFSITNSTVLAFLSCFITFLFISMICSNAKIIPNIWQHLFENCFEFVYFTVLVENVKQDGSKYFPIIFTVFLFLFSCNLLGMIPYSFTVTSHIIITLAFSMLTFVGINIIGFRIHGFHLFSLFLPSGAPLLLAPLLIPIELVSYSFRLISLALRLFANMMSGHCLLKILAGFA